MDTFKGLVVILMSSVLVNNYVLNRFLGICPFLGVSKKLNQAVGMGISVIFVMLVASAVTWPIQKFILEKIGLEYTQTIVFILVIAALVQFIEIILKNVAHIIVTDMQNICNCFYTDILRKSFINVSFYGFQQLFFLVFRL